MIKFKNYLGERVDTTQNASVTELFPALAFNMNFKPRSVEDFKKFLYKVNLNTAKTKKTFVNASNIESGKKVIDNLTTMSDKMLKDKLENAIGITDYLYDLHNDKPIDKVVWGYREKPRGIPEKHAGDIFVFFKNKKSIGISLKAGTKKSKEPLTNTYVATQYKRLGVDMKPLEDALWSRVYSKLPGIEEVAKKSNYIERKGDVTPLFVDLFLNNREFADELYKEMLKVSRQQMCKVLNDMSTPDFVKWVKSTFNIQRKGETVPLILVKAVGKKAEQKGDDIADILPLVISHNAYLNKKSVQEYFIDIKTPEDSKTIIMTIRSDKSIKASKGSRGQGRLGQYTMLSLIHI
mgnify:FL=1